MCSEPKIVEKYTNLNPKLSYNPLTPIVFTWIYSQILFQKTFKKKLRFNMPIFLQFLIDLVLNSIHKFEFAKHDFICMFSTNVEKIFPCCALAFFACLPKDLISN